MSTRVQKGSHVFKPVAKPRGRPSTTPSRQSSEAATSNENPAASSPVLATLDSMPPPTPPLPSEAITPGPPPKVIPSFTSLHHTHRSSNTPSVILPSAVPQTISQHSSSNIVSVSVPAESIVSSTTSTPIVVPPLPVNAPVAAANTMGQSHPLQQVPTDAPSTSELSTLVPLTMHMVPYAPYAPPVPHITTQLGSVSVGTAPRLDINADDAAKCSPNRRSGRGKRRLSQDDDQSAAADSAARQTRSKKSRNFTTVCIDAELSDQSPVAEKATKKRLKRNTHQDGTTQNQRKTKVSSKSRKHRVSSVPPFDPDVEPGEELDPTAVTMATLCKDTGQGRISSKAAQIQSNHAAWKASNREKRTKMKSLMQSKKYGLSDGTSPKPSTANPENTEPIAEEDTEAGPSVSAFAVPADTNAQQDAPVAADESGHGFDYSQSLSTSRFNVQVRIGPNGETIIDEESLFIDRNEEEATETYTHVEESDTTKFVNSGTYGRKYRGTRWSTEETELFYDALSQFGENYELISYVLPGRDRTSCKNKFKAEDKKNPSRITYCLNNRIPYDMQTLSRMTGKDFSGPTPEICPPIRMTLAEKPQETTAEPSPVTARKQSHASRPRTLRPDNNAEEEILGDSADFDQYKDD